MATILYTEPSDGYELLDSGDGYKLERYGEVIVSRPDPQVLWPKMNSSVWTAAHAVFEHEGARGKWKALNHMPASWAVQLRGLTFSLKLSPFKHVGLFPEQSAHWQWLEKKISDEVKKGRSVRVLNLFGYTGGASLVCAKAGAEVVHVDASETATAWAKINRDLSGLSEMPIRFIVDDVRKFVEREIRRGNQYDVILLDPPIYGRGMRNEVWKIDKDLIPLLERLGKLLSNDPLLAVLNGYASGYSHIAYAQALEMMVGQKGHISSGELAIKETHTTRLLPCGIFACWEK